MTRPRVEIGIDCLDPFALAPFWEAALGYMRAEGDGHPYLNLAPADGDGPVVFLQRVPEGKGPKNRVHLDLYTRAPELLVERLVGLGGVLIGDPVGRATAGRSSSSPIPRATSCASAGRSTTTPVELVDVVDDGRRGRGHRPSHRHARASDFATGLRSSSSAPRTAASSSTAAATRRTCGRDGGTSPSAAW